MKKFIESGKVFGDIIAPASKSMMQRAVACAVLAKGETILNHPSTSEDALASLHVAECLGAKVERTVDQVRIYPRKKEICNTLHCKEAGLCVRMFAPICALWNEPMTLTGEGSLLKRPMDMVEDSLKELHVSVALENRRLPMTIQGPLLGGNTIVDGSQSSQFLTGLLLALPCAPKASRVRVMNLKSRPYMEMTLDIIKEFGGTIFQEADDVFEIPGGEQYRSRSYEVEGDFSGAAFLLVAGAIAGDVKVKRLKMPSLQADSRILEVLKNIGANVEIQSTFVRVQKNRLNAFQVDATDCPDLFPPLVTLASYCEGTSVIKGADRLKNKESNRGIVLQTEFQKFGIELKIDNDVMKITGGKGSAATIDSYNDHRIAMAAAVFALGLPPKEGVEILNAECVKKSYPRFYNDIDQLRVRM